MADTAEKKVSKRRKETFMQGIITLIFSQLLIKLLGLVYNLYLTNREGFGDQGNGTKCYFQISIRKSSSRGP